MVNVRLAPLPVNATVVDAPVLYAEIDDSSYPEAGLMVSVTALPAVAFDGLAVTVPLLTDAIVTA